MFCIRGVFTFAPHSRSWFLSLGIFECSAAQDSQSILELKVGNRLECMKIPKITVQRAFAAKV